MPNLEGLEFGFTSLCRRTVKYTSLSVEANEILIDCWNGLIERGKQTWERIVKAKNLQATGLDELEVVEQQMVTILVRCSNKMIEFVPSEIC